ncbi:MAG: hypothetical protein FWF10_09960 [Clostridiales bacterium]|nr:hypothetical protein [Clostridiales bacterium]
MFKSKRTVIRENDAQAAQIAALEARLSTIESEAQVLRAREDSVVRVLSDATSVAGKIRNDAETDAAITRDKLRRDADETRKETEMLIEVAYQNARDIVREAEEQNRIKIAQAERIVQNYAALLHQFHDLMRINAEQAQQHAQAYAELTRRMQAELPSLPHEGVGIPAESAVPLAFEEARETETIEVPEVAQLPLMAEPEPETSEPEEKVWKVDEISAEAILNANSDEELHALIDSILRKNRG